MSGFECPHCGETIHQFGQGGGERTATNTGVPFLGRIPFDPQMVSCGDAGVSYQEKRSVTQVALAFSRMAKTLAELSVNQ